MRTLIIITVLVILFISGCGQYGYNNPYDSPYFVEQVRQQHRNAENINRQLQGNPNYWQEEQARQEYWENIRRAQQKITYQGY